MNDLNRLHYTILADPADVAAVKATLHAAPGAIGGTTPAAGTFTTLTTTSSSIDSSNTLAVKIAGLTGLTLQSSGVGMVNSVHISCTGTGVAAFILATGETNVGLTLSSKGTGNINFVTDGFSSLVTQFRVLHTASSSRFIIVTGSNGGNPTLTTSAGSVILTSASQIAFGGAALATGATIGFPCMQTCAGTPTGVPANIPTGQVPWIYDSTNEIIYVYNGAWKKTVALT